MWISSPTFAFPTLTTIILGPKATNSITDDMLLEAFSNSISPMDAAVIKDALKVKGTSFRKETLSQIVSLMSQYDSQVLPSPMNLREQIIQVS